MPLLLTGKADVRLADDKVASAVIIGVIGYGCFSFQDALMKWLSVKYPISESMFIRAVTIILIVLLSGRGSSTIEAANASKIKPFIALRTVIVTIAWALFYSASRMLTLPEMTLIYFTAPIMGVVAAAIVLKERISLVQGLALIIGFAGVIFTSGSGGVGTSLPFIMAFFAACLWAANIVLVRWIGKSESSLVQMLLSNLFFALINGVLVYPVWIKPSLFDLGLMLMLGVVGGFGQFLTFEAFRRAQASIVAPTEYSSLFWAMLLGYLVWHEIPTNRVLVGATLVLCGNLVLFVSESVKPKPKTT